MKIFLKSALTLASLLTCSPSLADDRINIEHSEWRHADKASQAVALVTDNASIYRQGDRLGIYTRMLGSRFELCHDQNFYEQPSVVGACTAFLIAPDKMLTSPSCILGPRDCSDKKFVFDVAIESDDLANIPKDKVYSCVRVEQSYNSNTFGGYTLVSIDRPAIGRIPLRISKNSVNIGQEMVMISHNHGLSQQQSRAFVWNQLENKHRFRAGFSSHKGAEGAPVFDKDSGEVTGLLFSNLNNRIKFNKYRGCYEQKMCTGESCFLEIITSATRFNL